MFVSDLVFLYRMSARPSLSEAMCGMTNQSTGHFWGILFPCVVTVLEVNYNNGNIVGFSDIKAIVSLEVVSYLHWPAPLSGLSDYVRLTNALLFLIIIELGMLPELLLWVAY